MASGLSSTDMEQELLCPICLDCLSGPVTLECGHNFCRSCITAYCDKWKELGALECPVCKAEIQKANFPSNWQLANVIKNIKQMPFPASKTGGKDLCSKQKCKFHFFGKDGKKLMCRICESSPEHRGHSLLTLGKAAHLHKAFGAARKERVCQKHQEPLKLFCQDDEALICVVCDRSKEHRDHKILPLEEASQEYKDQFSNRVEILRKERAEILVYKANITKESEDVLKQTTREKQEAVAKFRQLHTFLEEQEELLLAQMEELEKEVARERDGHLAKLSEALSSLDSLIREMEEKCQQPAGDLLQDARSTLQRYEEKEAFDNPAAFPLALKWHIWDFSDFSPLLGGLKNQWKDTLASGLDLQEANVTLDPDTAHPRLILSKDHKSMRQGEKAQSVRTNPERFDVIGAVLGREGFTGGSHFWEVLVGSEEGWAVGVVRKSVKRKGPFVLKPKVGIWEVGKWWGSYKASVKNDYVKLPVSGELKRVRVCLNYVGGRVAFFDADRAALLYEYSGASFSGETVFPFFWVHIKGQLTISS